jgi:hypothetical protein
MTNTQRLEAGVARIGAMPETVLAEKLAAATLAVLRGASRVAADMWSELQQWG